MIPVCFGTFTMAKPEDREGHEVQPHSAITPPTLTCRSKKMLVDLQNPCLGEIDNAPRMFDMDLLQ